MNHDLIGVIAGTMSFAAYALYIVTTLLGKTKPNRATWWILTFVGALIAESYYGSGADATIWIALSYVIGPFIIAVLSLQKRFRADESWSKLDKFCLSSAIACLIFRVVSRNHPTTALVLDLTIDFIGLMPTIAQAYKTAENEDRIAWAIELGACIINMFAIETWSFEIWVHPMYLVVMNFVIVACLFQNKLCHAIAKKITNTFKV